MKIGLKYKNEEHIFDECISAGVPFLKYPEVYKRQEKYRKMPLLVSRENAVELEEDEYYMADIIGMDVYTEDGEKFGVLEDIMETGANDVYVVSTEAHTEVLLPAIHDCILDVDTENRKMTVHLMDGLI